MFVETEKDLYIPNLTEYITFEKNDSKNIINVNCGELLETYKEKIKSIEIYYNSNTTELKHNIQNAEIFDIVTNKKL